VFFLLKIIWKMIRGSPAPLCLQCGGDWFCIGWHRKARFEIRTCQLKAVHMILILTHFFRPNTGKM